jgi:hypothetical protein
MIHSTHMYGTLTVRKSPKHYLAGQLAQQVPKAPKISYPDVQYSAVHEHAGFHFLVMVI